MTYSDLFIAFRMPLWVLVTTQLTYALTCLNCCVNFVIYCVMYSAFRKELTSQVCIIGQKVQMAWNMVRKSYFPTLKQNSSSFESTPSVIPNRNNQPSRRSADPKRTPSALEMKLIAKDLEVVPPQ